MRDFLVLTLEQDTSKKLHFIVEGFDLNAPQIAEKIDEWYSILKNTESPDKVAIKINSILLHGEQIPLTLLNSAWEIFAKKNGVKNE